MPAYQEHKITEASFAQIDREIGPHSFTPAEYAVVRRIIHTTADFEFTQLVKFSHDPFTAAYTAFTTAPILVTDVSMVAAGIATVGQKTWKPQINIAVKQPGCPPEQTRSAYGMRLCAMASPQAVFIVGNAPTALLALCEGIRQKKWKPALVVGVPVGFINVVESKAALAQLSVPHILVEGRKGGSAVAAAIANALMIGAWRQSSPKNNGRSDD
ncbi:MAG: cobalt-precorrin-8X methylmutase [Leptolyngbya foveolarum]|uniref:Cobalt-precorrin-8X methylmutase n=1 Tax=Leptolyngbya foveolarum TaxID=47253 RepID=A0A2W4UUT4_9CYAN|nr:MAG: cobalt-precorrin-8X methylmutase [Leptolyngbya foveolarum]